MDNQNSKVWGHKVRSWSVGKEIAYRFHKFNWAMWDYIEDSYQYQKEILSDLWSHFGKIAKDLNIVGKFFIMPFVFIIFLALSLLILTVIGGGQVIGLMAVFILVMFGVLFLK